MGIMSNRQEAFFHRPRSSANMAVEKGKRVPIQHRGLTQTLDRKDVRMFKAEQSCPMAPALLKTYLTFTSAALH